MACLNDLLLNPELAPPVNQAPDTATSSVPVTPPILREGRFLIRACQADDVEAFVEAVRESPDTLARWLDWAKGDYTMDKGADFLRRCAEDWSSKTSCTFGIFDRDSGGFVGGCGLSGFNHIHHVCNLGYWIRKSCAGRGAASAATRALARYGFEVLGLNRIELVIAVGNEASIAVARKCGAVEEGILRNRVVLDGRPVQAHMFSLIPADV